MSEQKRFEFREGLIEFIGEDKAEALMESLPPVSWDQLVTKDDLNALAAVIGAEFTAVRGEFAEKIGEVHKEIGGLHVAIAESTNQATAQFVELSHKMDSMRRWVVGSVVTVVGAVVGGGIWFG
ncbi:MAG: hypothetical protein F4098_09200 [Acidimicrobiaceae bacterium]|nr:hypothetical protein [Acidimicrobiaceae bacterium]MYD06509.1 hypothetical protein [Acidimicrobiaceae bacterium]MYI58812.1 hypothetical protein [Acidimicrobiaceae bacterium]